jgi:hypothetical protein
MTPKLVRRRYSNGRVLLVVPRKGYKKRGTCAARTQCVSVLSTESPKQKEGPQDAHICIVMVPWREITDRK